MGEFYDSVSLETIKPESYTKLRLTVRDNIGDAVFIPSIRFTLVKQDGSRAISDETPVLHSTHGLE